MFLKCLLILLMQVALSRQNAELTSACPAPSLSCPADPCITALTTEVHCIADAVKNRLQPPTDLLASLNNGIDSASLSVNEQNMIIMAFQNDLDVCIESLRDTQIVIYQTESELEVGIMDIETLTCRADLCQVRLNETYTLARETEYEIENSCSCNLTDVLERAEYISSALESIFTTMITAGELQSQTDDLIAIIQAFLEDCLMCNTTDILDVALIFQETKETADGEMSNIEALTTDCVDEATLNREMYDNLTAEIADLPNRITCYNPEGDYLGCEDLTNLTDRDAANQMTIGGYAATTTTFDENTAECQSLLSTLAGLFSTVNFPSRKCINMGGTMCSAQCIIDFGFEVINFADATMKCAGVGGIVFNPLFNVAECLPLAGNGTYLIDDGTPNPEFDCPLYDYFTGATTRSFCFPFLTGTMYYTACELVI